MQKILSFTKRRGFYILLCLILLVQVASKIAIGYFDTDTYFLLAEGKDIVTSGFKYTNTFTIIPDLKIVVQQWGWCVIVYAVNALAGDAGLIFLTVLETVLIAALLSAIGRKKKMDPAILMALVALFLFLFCEFISTRPNALTIILLLLQVLVLERYKEKQNGLFTGIALTAITLAEMNLHGSMWVFHFLFLLPYVFPRFKTFLAQMEPRGYKVKPLLLSMVPMGISLFLNPYGIDGILYLFRSYGQKLNSIGIAELQRVELTSLTGAVLVGALVFYVGFYVAPKRKIAPETAYLFLGTLILGLLNYRSFYYPCIGLFLLLCDALSGKRFDRFHDFANRLPVPVYFLAAAGVAVSVWQAAETGGRQEADWEGEPMAAVEYLDENTDGDAAVYTEFNNGAYLEWAGYTVYIDARPELFLKKINGKEDVLDEFLDVYYSLDAEMYEEFLEKYPFEYYLSAEGTLMNAYLECDEDMELVVDGEGYNLYKYTAREDG